MPGFWPPHPCEPALLRAGVTASRSPRVTALLRPLSQPEITPVPGLDLGTRAGAQHGLGRAAGAQGCPEGPAGASECCCLQLGFGLIPSAAGEASSAPSTQGIPWPGEVPPGVSRGVRAQGLGMSLAKGTPPMWGQGSVSRAGALREGGVRVPGSVCGWVTLSPGLAGSFVPGTRPRESPALQGPQGKLPHVSPSSGTPDAPHRVGQHLQSPGSTGGLCSAAGGQLGGLRLGPVSSHLSTMEQPSRVVP